MREEKKRIGLVLGNIDHGWARSVLPSQIDAAFAEKKSLFIFPGGRLNAPTDIENFRNAVYTLANSENLDGIIFYSPSLRNNQSDE